MYKYIQSLEKLFLDLGLNKIYKNLNVHNIYISKNFKDSIEDAKSKCIF